MKEDPVIEAMQQIARLESSTITRHIPGAGDTYVTIDKGPERMAWDLEAARLLRQTHGFT